MKSNLIAGSLYLHIFHPAVCNVFVFLLHKRKQKICILINLKLVLFIRGVVGWGIKHQMENNYFQSNKPGLGSSHHHLVWLGRAFYH